jgi:hypothetical protein
LEWRNADLFAGEDLHQRLGTVCDVREHAGFRHRLADEVDLVKRQVLKIERQVGRAESLGASPTRWKSLTAGPPAAAASRLALGPVLNRSRPPAPFWFRGLLGLFRQLGSMRLSLVGLLRFGFVLLDQILIRRVKLSGIARRESLAAGAADA